ncbi:hypothetical protein O3M35_002651 [Rhynocoris fuscipes]|uniref:AB hydrolase-1 domain-containing protein n=1 Tax=Rhynocoris fuscipes TaxID=488301 RepID=A0AAW1CPJ3_9HEMI
MGTIFNELMVRLGFEKYYVQGGDWGSIIGRSMAVIFPNRVLGYHSNMCGMNGRIGHMQMAIAYMFPSFLVDESYREDFLGQFSNLILESGYFHLQASKPDTVGVALSDSPAGLAAYILEKLSTWTNKAWRSLEDGGLEKYDKAALLDNVMIYWLTRSITTSMRLYSEAFSWKYLALKLDNIPVTVPTGCTLFPNELLRVPDFMLRSAYMDLVQVTKPTNGGHFAAFEVPDILAPDVWNFVGKLRERAKKQKPKSN